MFASTISSPCGQGALMGEVLLGMVLQQFCRNDNVRNGIEAIV